MWRMVSKKIYNDGKVEREFSDGRFGSLSLMDKSALSSFSLMGSQHKRADVLTYFEEPCKGSVWSLESADFCTPIRDGWCRFIYTPEKRTENQEGREWEEQVRMV
jgi:hypothetical protein